MDDFAEVQARAENRERWETALGLTASLWAGAGWEFAHFNADAELPVTAVRNRQKFVNTAGWLYGVLNTVPEDQPTPMEGPSPNSFRIVESGNFDYLMALARVAAEKSVATVMRNKHLDAIELQSPRTNLINPIPYQNNG